MNIRPGSRIAFFALAFAVAGFAAAKSDRIEVPLPAALDKIADVKQVEVKEMGGPTVASGSFATSRDSVSMRERSANLSGGGASGTAAIQLTKSVDSYTKREMNLRLDGLKPGAQYDLLVDGANVLTFASTKRGTAEIRISTDVEPWVKQRWK
jgi:hypothetical protein